ncbi:PREDICTED: serum response factor homolog [Nicrophorus vespilloides]|uniref:Serum response factor homolog n=1 Tax=Nicrophorus vespilloides TaxID=110193 RepID=A0ABM1M312_NICVS|nr:PREDICTED: serum response factor homolog [Nicrophorus vespilloides]
MEPGGRDSRFNLGYSMNLLSGESVPEIYGTPGPGGLRGPSTSLQQLSPRHTMVSGGGCGARGIKSDVVCYDDRGMSSQGLGLEACGVNDIGDDTYGTLQPKKSPPSNGKKTKGRVKIKMEYIENKLRRYTTFSKRKTGIMKKAYELSTLTGTQVMLLVASETGHVYTFATRKLQPMITSEAGKALIQTCLNSPDPPAGSASGDQRMSATGFEETELTYNISDEDSKDENMSGGESSDSSEGEMICGDIEPDFRIPTTTSPILNRQSTSAASSQSKIDASTTLSSSSHKPAASATSSSSSASTSSLSTTSTSISTASSTTSNNSSTSQIISPVLYQTPQGMVYATPSNGGVIFSLAPQGTDPSALGQFLTIPLSVMPTNGQGELDLSAKRK